MSGRLLTRYQVFFLVYVCPSSLQFLHFPKESWTLLSLWPTGNRPNTIKRRSKFVCFSLSPLVFLGVFLGNATEMAKKKKQNGMRWNCVSNLKLHMTKHSQKKKEKKNSLKFHSLTPYGVLYHSQLFRDVFDGLPQFFFVIPSEKPTASYCVHRRNFPSHVKLFFWAEVYYIIP